MLVSYFACQGRGCQMRSMLLLTKYNLFLHYQANTSCGSWVGYNSECHWMMDWLRSENEANNTEQHSAKHKQTHSKEDIRIQTSHHHPGLSSLRSLSGSLWPVTGNYVIWLEDRASLDCDRSNVAQNSDTHLMTIDPDMRRGLNLNNYDFVGTDQ